jgi:hypothetical protein
VSHVTIVPDAQAFVWFVVSRWTSYITSVYDGVTATFLQPHFGVRQALVLLSGSIQVSSRDSPGHVYDRGYPVPSVRSRFP